MRPSFYLAAWFDEKGNRSCLRKWGVGAPKTAFGLRTVVFLKYPEHGLWVPFGVSFEYKTRSIDHLTHPYGCFFELVLLLRRIEGAVSLSCFVVRVTHVGARWFGG